MIYTFVIAHPWQRIAELKRVRTISAFGRTEAEARAALKGMPLIRIRRESPEALGGAA